MRRRCMWGSGLLVVAAALCAGVAAQGRTTLDIYFIDVEGGQSTLVVTPAGEALLVDTGFPGSGGFDASPGDPAKARDAQRIVAAAGDAGVSRIDYLLITHFHADHDGGVPELAQLLPIGRSSTTAACCRMRKASPARSAPSTATPPCAPQDVTWSRSLAIAAAQGSRGVRGQRRRRRR